MMVQVTSWVPCHYVWTNCVRRIGGQRRRLVGQNARNTLSGDQYVRRLNAAARFTEQLREPGESKWLSLMLCSSAPALRAQGHFQLPSVQPACPNAPIHAGWRSWEASPSKAKGTSEAKAVHGKNYPPPSPHNCVWHIFWLSSQITSNTCIFLHAVVIPGSLMNYLLWGEWGGRELFPESKHTNKSRDDCNKMIRTTSFALLPKQGFKMPLCVLHSITIFFFASKTNAETGSPANASGKTWITMAGSVLQGPFVRNRAIINAWCTNNWS